MLAVIAVLIAGMALYPTIKRSFAGTGNEAPAGKPGNGQKRPPLNINIKVLGYETLQDIFRTKGVLIPDEEVALSTLK